MLLDIKSKGCWWMTVVFGSTRYRHRYSFWEELSCLGDLSACGLSKEKLGGEYITPSMQNFNDVRLE